MSRGKKPLLQTIGREMAITTHGFDDIPEGPNVFVANHACMRDIFAIPASLPEDCELSLVRDWRIKTALLARQYGDWL